MELEHWPTRAERKADRNNLERIIRPLITPQTKGRSFMELDRRTRLDADLRNIDLDEFFDCDFKDFSNERRELAARGVRHLGAPNLAVQVGTSAWTITAGTTLTVARGISDDAALVDLDPSEFSNWVQQQTTFNALQIDGSVRLLRGSKKNLAAWDAAWLSLLEGWPVFDRSLRFEDRNGAMLNLRNVFTPADSHEDIAHFFREAGFLHLRGWLAPDDMIMIGDEIDRALPLYEEGDGKSWWATVNAGERTCVRLQQFVEHSPTTAKILRSSEWNDVRVAVSGSDSLTQAPASGNCIEALLKPLGVVEGVSDIPWHRDCNLGRHAYQCAGIVVGISVDPGTEESGQLRVVAGSHRVCTPPYWVNRDTSLPVVPIVTERGDITLHQSCTLHEAMPPLVRPRRVMYTGFGLPARPENPAENDRQRELANLRERAHKQQSQPPSPVARV